MKNLIMADLKVLGNRLWSIPLSVFVLTLITALIFKDYDDSIMFINAAIIPVIFVVLSFSLMHYSEKSKLHNEIGSLPCKTNTLVLEKYLVLLLFLGFSFLANVLYLVSVELFYDINYDDVITILTVSLIVISALSLLAIPLFFKSKSAKTAYFGTIIWVAGLATVFGVVLIKLPPFGESIKKNILAVSALFIISVLAMIIIYFKDKRSGIKLKNLLIIPVFSVLPVTVFALIPTIAVIINQSLLFNFMLPGYKRMYLYNQGSDYLADAYRISQISDQMNFLFLNGITTLVLTGILIYVWKKGNIKEMIRNAVLVFLPLFFLAIEISLLMSIYFIEIILSGNNPRIEIDGAWFIAHIIVFIPMLLVSFHYSKKFLSEGGK